MPGGAGVRDVLAGWVDEVGPGLGAADLDRAPAELGVKAPGVQVLRADAEVAGRRPGGRHRGQERADQLPPVTGPR